MRGDSHENNRRLVFDTGTLPTRAHIYDAKTRKATTLRLGVRVGLYTGEADEPRSS